MVGEIFAGLGAIKTAFDMAQGLQKIHDTVARDRAVIELQKEILTAQSTQAALVEAVGALKGRVAQLEAWDADKQRYTLTDFWKWLAGLCFEGQRGERRTTALPLCSVLQ